MLPAPFPGINLIMRYEGPIYRPPSEAFSLLIQATVGCPHNKCSFCMIYKQGPPFRVRPVAEICADMDQAAALGQKNIATLFFPAGNTMAMETKDLAAVCDHARKVFPRLERITVYGSSPFIDRKSQEELNTLARAGLSRIHVGLESGDDEVLKRVKKGDHGPGAGPGRDKGPGGRDGAVPLCPPGPGRPGTDPPARPEHGPGILNQIRNPHFVRLRTLVPKINTLLLHQIKKGRFRLLGAHGILAETRLLLENLDLETELTSDHYTNYLNLSGRLPQDKERLLAQVDQALTRPETDFRPIFIGEQ